ncbi:MAG: circadian clock KaiB family protein [Bacteroidales bacterium]|nr:circadian clock KaiB family protein [Bacteroidales bacterium]MCF8386575.1 circadian clock KaiB family protein [Bacteroidales bacterium]MCF8397788.1 circadian clock KaiB family protein [Bacteroidales bacterium]
MNKYTFKLFLTGKSARSEGAVKTIKQILKDESGLEFKLDIIDVLESPDIAEQNKVLATPTLIKLLPPPVKRLVGDLNDKEKVKQYLDIQ